MRQELGRMLGQCLRVGKGCISQYRDGFRQKRKWSIRSNRETQYIPDMSLWLLSQIHLSTSISVPGSVDATPPLDACLIENLRLTWAKQNYSYRPATTPKLPHLRMRPYHL